MDKIEIAKYMIDNVSKNKKCEILNVKGQDEFDYMQSFNGELPKCSRYMQSRKMVRKLTIEISYCQTLGDDK